jgi:tRNA(Ile)-lysidine synthase
VVSRTLAQALHDFKPELPLAVAYSGGADSTALLLACRDKWPGLVQAIHVNHGLQVAADAFEQHCREFCQRIDVTLHVCKVDARAVPGQSPEDAARRARYAAFHDVVANTAESHKIRAIALAQHADDQVETILLALSRGAGLAGLSAMPAQWDKGGVRYYRPLLGVPGAALREWLAQRGESFITDPTNTDEQLTRNRIRARLLPALEASFPQFRETFSRSASHAAQAVELLNEIAAQDLQRVGVPPQIALLQSLSRPRQANVLRYWLKTSHQVTASAAQLAELLDQVASCTTRGHAIEIKVGQAQVQRKGAHLTCYNP